jgi:Arc/MetJ-type ribon-helix-helix transcriptional regulator
MADMARRTTVVLTPEDEQALQRASRASGLSQSELIRKGIRAVTSEYRRKTRPLVGWLKLSKVEREEVARESFGDFDS